MKVNIKLLLLLTFTSASPLSLRCQTVTYTTEIPSTKVSSIDGVGWATPIGTSFKTGNVYWTYIDPQYNGVVARKTPDGVITTKIVMTNIINDDNHAEMSLGVDNDGYIHVMGGHHNSPPRYYVSSNPDNISRWDFRGNDTVMGGIEGKGITYQGFYRSNNGNLFVCMRSNLINNFVSGDRSIALGRYNTQTKKWKMLGGKNYKVFNTNCSTITGEENGMTAFVWNPSGVGDMRGLSPNCASQAHYQGYQLRIMFDKNNGMHVTYNMSDSININYGVSDVSKFMTHVFYAFSPDEGDNWYKASGEKFTTMPLTKTNGDLVYKKLPTGYQYPALTDTYTMQNTDEIALDLDGKPIIMQAVFVPNETKSFKWNGTKWVDITYDLTFQSEKLYTGLYRGETYCFGDNMSLLITTDNQNSWLTIPSTVLATYGAMLDRYYFQKTGKLRVYARDSNGATVITVAPKGGEINKKVYTILASASNGTVTPTSETFCEGLTAIVYAKPALGYAFDHWSGDATGNLNPLFMAMNANRSVVANFVLDNKPPTVPNNVMASRISTNSLLLSWDASFDNDAVKYYEVYKDDALLLTTTIDSVLIDKLADNSNYVFKVRAKDNNTNFSEFSPNLDAKTLKAAFVSNETMAYEYFNYPANTLNPDPDNGANNGEGFPASSYNYAGKGFRNSWGTLAKVNSSGLQYFDTVNDSLLVSGNSLLLENAYGTVSPAMYRNVTVDPFEAFRVSSNSDFGANNQTIWFSYLLKVQDVNTLARLFFKTATNAVQFYTGLISQKLCLTSASSSVPVGGVDVQVNTINLLVGRITFGAVGPTATDDVVDLWVNPLLASELGTPTSTLTGVNASFSQFQTRTFFATGQPQLAIFDEFRIGKTKLSVLPFAKSTGLKSSADGPYISIYPNPASSYLQIMSNLSDVKFTMMSIDGKTVSATQLLKSNAEKIDLSYLSKGVYFIRFSIDNQIVVKKLIIK